MMTLQLTNKNINIVVDDVLGTIPASIGNLLNLTVLHLWNNKLTGKVYYVTIYLYMFLYLLLVAYSQQLYHYHVVITAVTVTTIIKMMLLIIFLVSMYMCPY